MAQVVPPRWSDEELTDASQTAMAAFREMRVQEPLEQYLDSFEDYRQTVEDLIEGTVDLTDLHAQAVDLLTQPDFLTAIRYLASPAISEDDLKVLANTSLSRKILTTQPAAAQRIIDTILLGLDRNRFPWVSEQREPTEAERGAAVISTAALIATQKVQTARRNSAKEEQENAVADALVDNEFVEVDRRHVQNSADLPEAGEFCRESLFGTRKADIIARLWDGRAMPIECKVSNSATNSVKRLNNDAAAKATTWNHEFGTNNVVPTAVLSGVFKIHNLRSAQADGLTLFWAHDLRSMISFIESTQP